MSDFIDSSVPLAPKLLQHALERHLGFVTSSAAEYHGEWGSLAVIIATHDADPVYETESTISVVIGTPVVRLTHTEPSLLSRSNREPLHRLLASPPHQRWDELLDGIFAVLHIDKSTRAAFLITDLFAWIPVFAAAGERAAVVGTHVNAVADVSNRADSVDEVSAVERIAYSTIAWPNTLYDGVTQLPPASRITLHDSGAYLCEAHWQPVERSAFSSIEQAATELRRRTGREHSARHQGHGCDWRVAQWRRRLACAPRRDTG